MIKKKNSWHLALFGSLFMCENSWFVFSFLICHVLKHLKILIDGWECVDFGDHVIFLYPMAL